MTTACPPFSARSRGGPATRSPHMAHEDTLRQDVEALKADLMAIRTDLKGLGRDLASAAKASADAAKDRVRSAVEAAASKGEEAAKKIHHAIEEKPLTSVLVAFGTGLLLGAILRK